jgi:lipid-binding SYLF domain-containing protein
MKRLAIAALMLAGCATSPPTRQGQNALVQEADSTLGEMRARDPSIDNVLHGSYAYAVFPDVGKAGAGGVGGAYGRGILFEHGRPSGFVKLEAGSVGAQLGGQTYAELLVLRDQNDVDRLKSGHFDLGANVSAVAIKTGAAAATDFRSGEAVFVMPRGGAMIEASVAGQRIDYQPAG